jgi:hypothetical protein
MHTNIPKTHIQQTLIRHTNRQTNPALAYVLPAVPVRLVWSVRTRTTNTYTAACSPSPHGHLNLIS